MKRSLSARLDRIARQCTKQLIVLLIVGEKGHERTADGKPIPPGTIIIRLSEDDMRL